MSNPEIGTIQCPVAGVVASLRRCRTGQRLFYWMSTAGKITPNLAEGQQFVYERATFNDPEDKRQLGDYLKRKLPGFKNPEQPEETSRVEGDEKPEKTHKPVRSASFLEALLGGDEDEH